MIDWKQKYHTGRHSGNRRAVIRNPVFSMCHWVPSHWIPGSACSRPGMTTFLFRFYHYIIAGYPVLTESRTPNLQA